NGASPAGLSVPAGDAPPDPPPVRPGHPFGRSDGTRLAVPGLDLVVGQELDLVVVVVQADELQALRRRPRLPGHGHLDGAHLLQLGDLLALLVEQVVGHVVGDPDLDAVDVLVVGGQLEHAHDVDGHALTGLDLAGAQAVGAVLVDAALQGRPDALAGHLGQAEPRGLEDLGAGPGPPSGPP